MQIRVIIIKIGKKSMKCYLRMVIYYYSTVIIAVVSVLCGLVLISAIGLFISCRKRTEKKKENIASAFFEFSADGKSTSKSAKTNKNKSSLSSSSL